MAAPSIFRAESVAKSPAWMCLLCERKRASIDLSQSFDSRKVLAMWRSTRAQIAAKSQKLPPDHPELIALKSKLRGEHLLEHVETELRRRPRPTDEQLVQIADTLLAARSHLTTAAV